MNKVVKLFSIVGGFAIAFLGSPNISAASQNPLIGFHANQLAQAPQSSNILLVQIPQMEINTGSGKKVEIFGQLIQPVNIKGQIIPAGGSVKLTVIPTELGDAYLVADNLLSNGYSIAIKASGSVIPGLEITDKSSLQTAREGSGLGAHLGERAALALGGKTKDAIQLGSTVDIAGTIIGSQSAKKRNVVQLTQGAYFLTLE